MSSRKSQSQVCAHKSVRSEGGAAHGCGCVVPRCLLLHCLLPRCCGCIVVCCVLRSCRQMQLHAQFRDGEDGLVVRVVKRMQIYVCSCCIVCLLCAINPNPACLFLTRDSTFMCSKFLAATVPRSKFGQSVLSSWRVTRGTPSRSATTLACSYLKLLYCWF